MFLLYLVFGVSKTSICVKLSSGTCPADSTHVVTDKSQFLKVIDPALKELTLSIVSDFNDPFDFRYNEVPVEKIEIIGIGTEPTIRIYGFGNYSSVCLDNVMVFLVDMTQRLGFSDLKIRKSIISSLYGQDIAIDVKNLNTDFASIDKFPNIKARTVILSENNQIPTKNHYFVSDIFINVDVQNLRCPVRIGADPDHLLITFVQSNITYYFSGVNQPKRMNSYKVSSVSYMGVVLLQGDQPLYRTDLIIISGNIVEFWNLFGNRTPYCEINLYLGSKLIIHSITPPNVVNSMGNSTIKVGDDGINLDILMIQGKSVLEFEKDGKVKSFVNINRVIVGNKCILKSVSDLLIISVFQISSKSFDGNEDALVSTSNHLIVNGKIMLSPITLIIYNLEFDPNFIGFYFDVDGIVKDAVYPVLSRSLRYSYNQIYVYPMINALDIGVIDDGLLNTDFKGIIFLSSPELRIEKHEIGYLELSQKDGFTKETSVLIIGKVIRSGWPTAMVMFEDLPGNINPTICIDSNVYSQKSLCGAYVRKYNEVDASLWSSTLSSRTKTLTILLLTNTEYAFDLESVKHLNKIEIGGMMKPYKFSILLTPGLFEVKTLYFKYALLTFKGGNSHLVFKNEELSFYSKSDILNYADYSYDFKNVGKLCADYEIFAKIPVEQSHVPFIFDNWAKKIEFIDNGWIFSDGGSKSVRIVKNFSTRVSLYFGVSDPFYPKPVAIYCDPDAINIIPLRTLQHRLFIIEKGWKDLNKPAIMSYCPHSLEIKSYSEIIPVVYEGVEPHRSMNIYSYNSKELIMPFQFFTLGSCYYPHMNLQDNITKLTIKSFLVDRNGGVSGSHKVQINATEIKPNVEFEFLQFSFSQSITIGESSNVTFFDSVFDKTIIDLFIGNTPTNVRIYRSTNHDLHVNFKPNVSFLQINSKYPIICNDGSINISSLSIESSSPNIGYEVEGKCILIFQSSILSSKKRFIDYLFITFGGIMFLSSISIIIICLIQHSDEEEMLLHEDNKSGNLAI